MPRNARPWWVYPVLLAEVAFLGFCTAVVIYYLSESFYVAWASGSAAWLMAIIVNNAEGERLRRKSERRA